MKLSVISFTKAGMALSNLLAVKLLSGSVWEQKRGERLFCELYTKCSRYEEYAADVRPPITYVKEEIGQWAGAQMQEGNALLFIGACGIAVRAVAPYVTDKLKDRPVLVMDERGKYVIPLLAGHVGGANELAKALAEGLGAAAVITTATDIQHEFAVDTFAVKNSLHIENKAGIAGVSAKLLAGEEIRIGMEEKRLREGSALPEKVRLAESGERADVLILCPKEYIIGMGCKKNTKPDAVEAFVREVLQSTGIEMQQIAALASIDRKKEEEGLLAFCEKQRIPFLTYTAEELAAIKGSFSVSSFVKSVVGVDNVCERAAMCACEEGGVLVVRKQSKDGMTIAVAKRRWSVTFDET